MTRQASYCRDSLGIILVLVLFAFAGCGKGGDADHSATAPAASAATAPSEPPAIPPALRAGDVAFIRVKEYTLYSGMPDVSELLGGMGYTLRSRSSGIVYAGPPSANDGVFSFGEPVTLIEKKTGPQPPGTTPGPFVSWVVEKNGKKVQLPGYLLARSKEEIDTLRTKGRIPDTMALVYKDDGGTKTWGVSIGGVQGTAVVDSCGLHLMDYPKGSSPFALKGNAVVFDASAVSEDWEKPLVFGAGMKPFKLSPYYMYYCVSDGENPAFEAVDPSAR